MAATNIEVWQKVTVIENTPIALGINKIILRQSKPAKAEPGTHIDVLVETREGLLRRSYSIVSQSSDLRDLTIGVLQVKNSRGGSVAMHALTQGTVIEASQPLQNFPLRIGAPQYVLIAGGIGVTALIEMANVLKSINADFVLHYSIRSESAAAFLPELIEAHQDRLFTYFDDQGSQLDLEALMNRVEPGTEMYVCGPIRMMDAVRRMWSTSDHEMSNLRFETFGASGWFEPEEFLVRIPSQNKEVLVGNNSSMLEALESAGLEMLSDCRKGECGLCEVRVAALTGSIDHRDVFYSQKQKDEQTKMTCCVSRVISENPQTQAVIEIITT